MAENITSILIDIWGDEGMVEVYREKRVRDYRIITPLRLSRVQHMQLHFFDPRSPLEIARDEHDADWQETYNSVRP
jgi:hypothetical protein